MRPKLATMSGVTEIFSSTRGIAPQLRTWAHANYYMTQSGMFESFGYRKSQPRGEVACLSPVLSDVGHYQVLSIFSCTSSSYIAAMSMISRAMIPVPVDTLFLSLVCHSVKSQRMGRDFSSEKPIFNERALVVVITNVWIWAVVKSDLYYFKIQKTSLNTQDQRCALPSDAMCSVDFF